jgi:hypothetical protein
MKNKSQNAEVDALLDEQNHPLRDAIEQLRRIILTASPSLIENWKWNAPNYSVNDQDRITMRVQPPKQIQLILHRGAKKLAQPKNKLINDESGLLVWKENDRAIASFKNISEVKKSEAALTNIIKLWIEA